MTTEMLKKMSPEEREARATLFAIHAAKMPGARRAEIEQGVERTIADAWPKKKSAGNGVVTPEVPAVNGSGAHRRAALDDAARDRLVLDARNPVGNGAAPVPDKVPADMEMVNNAALDAIALAHDEQAGARMMTEVFDFLGRFVAYPSEHARIAHALWIVHAHMMERWESTPRLAFLSPEPASGKTRALEITELLVPKPVQAVNVSPAYLFRKVGGEEGVTILFDEIDTVFGPKAKENEEIRGLLNAGHRKGAVAGRCVVKGKQIETEEIPAYAAVALAGLGWLPDTLLTRSVIIRMKKRRADEQVEPFRRRIHYTDGARVHALIQSWARSATVEWPDLPAEIRDRDADVWEPLIAIADAVGGEWPARARSAAVALVTASKEAEPSLGVRLLADLKIVFGNRDKMTTVDILAALHELPEAPWKNLKGEPLDDRGLAYRLRQYDVRSKSIPVGNARPKGYTRADLYDAWRRYVPPSPDSRATAATSATTPEPLAHEVADVAAGAHLSGHGGEGMAVRCAHCGGPAGDDQPLLEVCYGEVYTMLHRECLEPWREATDAGAG